MMSEVWWYDDELSDDEWLMMIEVMISAVMISEVMMVRDSDSEGKWVTSDSEGEWLRVRESEWPVTVRERVSYSEGESVTVKES